MFKFVVLSALLASGWAGRIVGGKDTIIEEHPYQVSLVVFGIHGCGGSIIGDKWVVTAGHCVQSSDPAMTIRAGITKLGENGQVRKIAKVHVHPEFNLIINTADYDMAILELESPLKLGPSAQIVTLVDEDFDPVDNSNVTCTGWGTLSETGPMSNTLQKVGLKVVNRKDCMDKYGEMSITDRMICAGVPEGGKDACQGDSGGPLVGDDGKLVGVVSGGLGCGRPGYPGVHTRVGKLRSFIKKITGI